MSNKTVILHFHICRSSLNKDIEIQLVTIFGKKLKSKVPDWSHKFNYAHKSTLFQNAIIYAIYPLIIYVNFHPCPRVGIK